MTAPPVPTVIVGAAGRMGLALVRLVPQFAPLRLAAAIVSPSSPALGKPMRVLAPELGEDGAILCSGALDAALAAGARLVIDFSSPAGVMATIDACHAARVPLLVGTTGLDAAAHTALRKAARDIPVLLAANTSLGVAVLQTLVRQAAALLPAEFDIEIVEIHHGGKRDAPSGTARALGEAAAAGRGQALEAVAVEGRRGLGAPRVAGQIGFASLRGGDVAGDHEVLFLGPQERLRLCHSATDRGIFARGALTAGRWLAAAPPGLWSMADVLNISK